jgi:hypothetical protein
MSCTRLREVDDKTTLRKYSTSQSGNICRICCMSLSVADNVEGGEGNEDEDDTDDEDEEDDEDVVVVVVVVVFL